MPDVTLPGGLKIDKKLAIGIGVASVGIAAVFYYRQKKAQESAPATTSDINPQTGYPYGSPEDQAALAAMAGSTLGVSNTGASWVGGSTIGYDQYGNPIYGTGPSGQPGSFVNNAQWAQTAESLMGSDGADAIAAALGKYLTAAPVTSDQITIIQQAIAVVGYPPIAGPTGFPPSWHDIPAPPPTPPPPPPGNGGGTSKGWYWHQSGRYYTFDGKKKTHPSGTVKIGGKTYYYHSVHNYFTVNGKRVAYPASGAST